MIPSDEYFKNLADARPLMESYNIRFTEKFNAFLRNQTYDMLMEVFEVQKDEVARSAGNSYSHINILYKICEIVMNEIGFGYVPITYGTRIYNESIDKYNKVVFMRRRVEFWGAEDNSENEDLSVAEARNYMISEKISPIALSYIIKHENGGEMQKAINYWSKVYMDSGMQRDAMLLSALHQKV